MKILFLALILGVVLGGKAFGQGVILWNESVNGPLSEDFHQPTFLGAMQIGTNYIIGSSEIAPPPPYWEYHPNHFIFQFPESMAVQSINLQINQPNVVVWIGNPEFTSQLAGLQNSTSGNLLLQWGLDSIPSGTYGMYFGNYDQENAPSIATFSASFVVQAVPEPSSMSLALVGLGLIGFTRRKLAGRTKNPN